jgi:hypothetical protein
MWHGDARPPLDRTPRMEGLLAARRDAAHPADARARAFTASLEEALLDFETGDAPFARARGKTGHIADLRRVLGLLLDVLADWELLAVTHRDG